MSYAIYIASVLGGLALLLMMPRQGYNPRKLGALLGAVTLGGLWLWLSRDLEKLTDFGLPHGAMIYYYIFSALAIGSAVRVITHPKPVFSALWFVMVVLSTAGLFVILSAEFMAFAMIIIYGGAILVTYVFVIMLAAQSGDPDTETAEPEYDRIASEPVAAITAGFLILAMLLSIFFNSTPMLPNPEAKAQTDIELTTGPDAILTNRPADAIAKVEPALAPSGRLDNAERIGLDLFRHHPLGLELAGVILLVSLIGAVVIARKQVEGETH